jgi:RimJ/RimL family protein N-acetyltransferase
MIQMNNPEHGYAIAEAAGVIFNPEADIVISRLSNEELVGGVLYNGYTRASINMHVAAFSPRWGSRDMLWVCFDYPFNQLGCKKVFGQVPSKNEHALEFNLKLGFKIETLIPDVFPEDDLLVVSMVREDCRWLNIKPRTLFPKEAV